MCVRVCTPVCNGKGVHGNVQVEICAQVPSRSHQPARGSMSVYRTCTPATVMYVTACILHVWIQTPELVYLAVCAFAMHLCGSLGGHASACVCVCVCVCARVCTLARALQCASGWWCVCVWRGSGPGTPGQAWVWSAGAAAERRRAGVLSAES